MPLRSLAGVGVKQDRTLAVGTIYLDKEFNEYVYKDVQKLDEAKVDSSYLIMLKLQKIYPLFFKCILSQPSFLEDNRHFSKFVALMCPFTFMFLKYIFFSK